MADIRQPYPQPPSTGRELVARPNFTIPGADAPYPRSGPPQAAPQPAAVAPQPTAATPQPGWFKRTANAIGDAGSSALRKASAALPSAPQGLRDFGNAVAKMPGKDAVLATAAEAPNIYEVGSNPNATKLDVATQYAESGARAAGATGGAALGGKLGLAAGAATGPFAPVAAPVLGTLGAVGGGLYGYYATDKAVEGGRALAGQDTRPVAQRLREDSPTAEQAAATRPGIRPFTPSDAGAGRGDSKFAATDPRRVADPATSLRKDFSSELASVPQNLPSGLEDGRVYKTTDANGRTVYSGRNVRENAGIVDGQGGLRGYLGGGNPEPATDAQGRRLDGRPQEFVAQGSAQPGAQAATTGQPPAAQPSAQAAATGQPPAAQNVVQAGASPSSFGLGGSDAAISQARQAAAARGDWDAVSNSYGGDFQGGGQPSAPSLRMGGGGYSAPSVPDHVARAEKFAQQVARSNAESAAMAAIKSGSVRERGRGMATLAQLAGGDQDAATSRYNNDNNAATSRYGSDNSLRGSVYSADSQNASSRYTADMGLRGAYAKNMPAQAQRQAQAMAMQMAGGDIPTALKIMAQQGYSGEGLIAAQGALNSDQTTQQNLSEGARKNAAVRFGQFMQTDEDGKPVAGAEGALLNSMESIIPGSTQMREDQLAAPVDLGRGVVMSGQAAVAAGLNVLKGLNTTNDNAFLQSIGWDPKNPRLDQLPDLNGAKLDRVGLVKGGLKGGNVSSGNYQLDLGGGRVLYLPHDQIGENELALLRARGVNVPK